MLQTILKRYLYQDLLRIKITFMHASKEMKTDEQLYYRV